MRIAIDAHGGDHAPEAAVRGALAAAAEWSDIEVIIVGLEERLRDLGVASKGNIHLLPATEIVEAEDEPVKAIRRKKDASMVVAGRLVREGQADAMISGGNTGALMALGLLGVGRLPGIDRPALAPMLPTLDGTGVLALDLGANMDSKPENLLQFAVMGSVYRKTVDGISKPRVGLLNVGTEAMKGNELTKEAYPLLESAPIHFIGNVEARDVLQGACDVLVCDGFAGNIMLKAMEGTAATIFKGLKAEFTSSLLAKLAASILRPGIMRFRKKLDYTEVGGAPLLGVNGVVIKSHGSSDANAFKNGIRQARTALKNKLVENIRSEIDHP